MDTTKKNQEENLILICEIWQTDYDIKNTIPMLLPCNHSLCIICLDKMNLNPMSCPFCRKTFFKSQAFKNLKVLWNLKKRVPFTYSANEKFNLSK
jgi:hypothetical protein